jgi:hypothetical protein
MCLYTDFLFVIKHVGSTTIFVRSNISQTSFKAVHFSFTNIELKCFRSFKNFDQEKFTEDLNKIDFDKLSDQDDVNKIYSDFEEAFIQTVDKHAPVKQRKPHLY